MKVIVFAPHPDDESLGCGGTLLRHAESGDELYWVILTEMKESQGFDKQQILKRKAEIEKVALEYGFKQTFIAPFAAAELDQHSMSELIGFVSSVIKQVEPNLLYLPYPNDIHSDHHVAFNAIKACTKSFRYPSVQCIRVYETLSETDFAISTNNTGFHPNYFVGIEKFLHKKIDILNIYESEMGEHPFPRSETSVKALANLRGTVAGVKAAEAFMTIREIIV